jgi:hypothetical protein
MALIWTSFAGYGYWMANIKRRNSSEGVLLGLLLGPIGCLIVATRRERMVDEIDQERVRLQEEARIKQDQENQRYAVSQADTIRRRQEAKERAEEARIRRAETFDRFSIWFDRAILKFGWFKALPEVAQPIVIGLLVALPLVLVAILIFGRR